MFYIDEQRNQNDQATTIKVNPIGSATGESEVKELESRQTPLRQGVDDMWYLVGATIGDNFPAVKNLLAKYGYQVQDENEAIQKIGELFATPEWGDFSKELANVVADTATGKRGEAAQESNAVDPVTAAIQAGGQIFGSIGNIIAGSQAKKIEEERGKNLMLQGLLDLKAKREEAAARRGKVPVGVWVILGLLIVGLVTLLIVMAMRKKKS